MNSTCFLNGFDGVFVSLIVVTIPKKIVPNSDFYEVGKLIVNEKMKSVYERKSGENVISDRIIPRNIIKGKDETIFAFNVLTKDKTNPTRKEEISVKTKTPFHRFFAESNPEGVPFIQVKHNRVSVKFDQPEISYLITDEKITSSVHGINMKVNWGCPNSGELVCQINAERYTPEQARVLAKCVISSAYSTILYLTGVSDKLVERKE